MKKLLPLFFFLLITICSSAQISKVVFHENFETATLPDSVTSSGGATWKKSTKLFSSGLRSDTCIVPANDTAYLTTDSFNTLGKTFVTLKFTQICKIEFFDRGAIEVSTNNGATWKKLTTNEYLGAGIIATSENCFTSTSYPTVWKPADDIAKPDNSWWRTEEFNISSIAANAKGIRIRFKLYDGQGGTAGAKNNYGWLIDDIKVIAASSELIPPVVTLTAPLLNNGDSVYFTGPFEIYATITDASGLDSTYLEWTLNGGTPVIVNMINTSGNAYVGKIDTIPVTFKIGDTLCYKVCAIDNSPAGNTSCSTSPGCNTFYIRNSPPPPNCGTPVTSFPFCEYFEGFTVPGIVNCYANYPLANNWINETGDGMDWAPFSGPTPDAATGPSGDHTTGSGKYLYLEASSCYSKTALLKTPCVNISSLTTPVLEFWYHMYDMYASYMGELHVDIYYGGKWVNDIMPAISGNQGDEWHKIEVNLTPYKSVTQIRFRGITGTNYISDIAIDDIKIWVPPANDAGVISIDEPVSPAYAGNQPVKVSIKNFGSANLTDVDIDWSVDGVLQPTYNWTGLLLPGDTVDTLTIGNYNFSDGVFVIKAWTKDPNSSADGFVYNDTTQVSIIVCASPLKGNYSIGTSSTDFITFDDALYALYHCGVDSAVVFNIDSGTYNRQLLLTPVPGASATNTITFQSATGNNTDVVISYAATTQTDNYVIKLDSADYIKFENITISATGTGNYACAVNLSNNANHNEFSNNIIKGSSSASSYVHLSVIYSDYSSYTSPAYDYNIISNNMILNGSYGIYFRGYSSFSLQKGNIIEGNTIKDFYQYGIYLNYEDSIQIKSNIIENPSTTSSTSYGIYARYCDNGMQIVKNKINVFGTSTVYGLHIYYCDATSATPSIIANNFITQDFIATGNIYGIYCNNSTYQYFYHNSVNITSGSATGTGAFYLSGGSNINVLNNILVNTGGGYSIYVQTTYAITSCNYNDLYTTGSNIGYWNGSVTNLANWQSISGHDANSITVDPEFMSATNLHTISTDINNTGTRVTYITDDIDGDVRDTLTPDIGADEFRPLPNDAGIAALVNPIAPCPGNNDIIVKLKNFGTDTLKNVTINWEVNGVLQTPLNYTDTLLVKKDTTVLLATYTFNNGITYNLKFWTSYPNGILDTNNLNDTILVNGLQTAISGIYTIGSLPTDSFSDFTSAVNYLIQNGICGPVTFKVASGIYTEQIVIPEISGATSTNTITFESASGDSTSVTLTYAPSLSTYNYIVKLDGADYITFRNLTISSSAVSYYGRVIEFANGANYNTFSNNILQSINSTSSNSSVIYSNYPIANSHNTIKNNRMLNGYYSIYFRADQSSFDKGNIIEGNTIKDFNSYGIYAYYQDSMQIHLNTIENSSTANTVYGIFAYYSNNAFRIIKNKIIVTGTSSNQAMYLNYCDGTASLPCLIANNFISQSIGSYTAYGIYSTSCNYQNIYFNSVNIAGGGATTGAAFRESGGTNINIKNNIFANKGGGYAYYVQTPTAITSSDYNCFYTLQGADIGYWQYATVSNLAALQSTSGKDLNSLFINPVFVSTKDLHVSCNELDAAGTPITGIVDDIDGEPRDIINPDIGADEFEPIPNDAGAVRFIQPIGTEPEGSSIPVIVIVKNFGSDTIKNMDVVYKLNNGTPVTYTWNGSLPYKDTDTITFTGNIIVASGMNEICAYTVLVNDSNNLNDTACKYFFGIPPVVLFEDDFEGTDYWSYSNPFWQRGVVSKTTINSAHSPVNVWATRLLTNYQNSWTTYLYSPEFDFTGISGAVLKFWHWIDTEEGSDGGNMKYSFDQGATWITLGLQNDPKGINWYNSFVNGKYMWSKIGGGWEASIYDLSQFDNAPSIKFCYVFYSDNSGINLNGWAIDDFAITVPKIAKDAGVTSIIEPTVPNPGNAVYAKVTIKNYGKDVLTSVPVVYKVDNALTKQEICTATILPDSTVEFTFTIPFISKDAYKLCIYTKLSGDDYKFNDTTCANIGNPGINDKDKGLFRLEQNIPNPADNNLIINYTIPTAGNIRFELLNILGQKLHTEEYIKNAGTHQIEMNVKSLPAGIYYYSVEFDKRKLVKKMIVN